MNRSLKPALIQSAPRRPQYLALLACLFALTGAVSVFGQDLAAANSAIDRLRAAAGGEVKVVKSTRNGLANFIAAPRGAGIPVSDRSAITAGDRALSFVEDYGRAFGLRREEVAISRVETDDLGLEHVRLRQVISGVPVTGGELVVHLRGRQVEAANGQTLEGVDQINVVPAISALDAEQIVRSFTAKNLKAPNPRFSAPRLEILNQPLLGGKEFPTRLAWFIEVTDETVREFVWIDAARRIVLLHFSQLTDAKNRTIYNGNSTFALPGTLLRSEGGAPIGGDTDANLAYDLSGVTYDYYLTNHGRDSYDNLGGPLTSTVRHCPDDNNDGVVDPGQCPYVNAFWNGQQMVYGAGYASADDVVAHELTHAVTEKSASLFYYMQSGALNESFSDIFGETVDQLSSAGGGNDTVGVKWLLGEDLPSPGAIRNMANPNAFGDPGKMSDSTQFLCSNTLFDSNGVHINSGVPNHAFQLMVDGGTYNSVSVAGIGLTKAAKIQYRALTSYLTSASNFLDNYNALQAACSDLVGTSGITAGNCAEVKNAMDAVQMSNPWPCGAGFGTNAAKPALCSAGQHAVDVFFDGFESGLGNWSIGGTNGTDVWSRTSDFWGPNAFSSSGSDSAWGYNFFLTSDATLARNASVSIPANARLQFNHSYAFENSPTTNWDGGVVEYSTNGGSSWTDISSLYSAGATYGGVISSGDTNPLAGRSAFVKDSFGYTSSQYNLSSLSGQSNVRFRFRVGTDSEVDDYGWFIDDFRVYTCQAGGVAAPAATTNAATSITQTTATLNASINPSFLITTASFDYGLTTSYGNITPLQTVNLGGSSVGISAPVAGLTACTTYHYRARASNLQGTTNGADATFTSACASVPSVLTSPTPGSTLTGASQTFIWTTGTAISQYWLSIGNTLGGNDLYDLTQGTNLSVTVNGLPTDGRTLYARLWSKSGTTWLFNDYTYTAFAAPVTKAVMLTPTPGSTLTGSSQSFTWTAGISLNQYWLSIGNAPGGNDIYDLTQGTNLSVTVNGLPTDGRTLYVRLWSKAGTTWLFNDYTYTAFVIAKAAMVTPTPGSALGGSSQAFTWSTGSGINQYWLSIGNTAGGSDLYDLTQGTNLSVTVNSLPTDGRTLYVRLWSKSGTTWLSTDYTYTAYSAPIVKAVMTSPTPGSALTAASQTFTWNAGSGLNQYWLSIGNAPGGADIYDLTQGTNLSVTVNGLPTDGRTLYVRLWSKGGTTWVSNDYTYTAFLIAKAAMVTPAPGSTLGGSSQTFTWNAGSGISQYWLSIGNTLGGAELYDATQGTNLSIPITGLPTDGRTLFVRLWSKSGATWLSTDYTYTAYTIPIIKAVMTSPAPGSTLAGTTQTFTWNAGSGISQYWLSVGNTPGGADIYDLTQGTNLSKTLTGLPADGRTLYVRLWSKSGTTWLFNDYTFVAFQF